MVRFSSSLVFAPAYTPILPAAAFAASNRRLLLLLPLCAVSFSVECYTAPLPALPLSYLHALPAS
jgi:hypothetical protein